jgi:hypothetical protein
MVNVGISAADHGDPDVAHDMDGQRRDSVAGAAHSRR